jgi:hypothetical protein
MLHKRCPDCGLKIPINIGTCPYCAKPILNNSQQFLG